MRTFLSFLFLLGVVAACSGSTTTISASDYDQRCTTADDCAAVADGDICGCSGCPNAAIAKTDVRRYQADVAARHDGCPTNMELCPASCPAFSLACVAGRCAPCTGNCTDGGASDAGADGG